MSLGFSRSGSEEQSDDMTERFAHRTDGELDDR